MDNSHEIILRGLVAWHILFTLVWFWKILRTCKKPHHVCRCDIVAHSNITAFTPPPRKCPRRSARIARQKRLARNI